MINTRIIMRLWLAIVLLAFLEWKAVHDTDIFWQIKLGQIMIEERALPSVDRFTYTHYGEPAPAIGWLAQVGFALLYNVGGWPLVRLIHHVALVGALIVATIPCRRLAVSTSSALVAAVIAFLVLLSNADLRPQGLGLLCFSAVLAIAHSALSPASKIVTALPILIAWQNIRPRARGIDCGRRLRPTPRRSECQGQRFACRARRRCPASDATGSRRV
jgi:hypothetical protein